MSDQNIEQVRAIALQLADRVKNDPSFKEQVQKDPGGALVKAGLPGKYVEDFVREAGLTDVEGYQFTRTVNCMIDSCILGSF